MIKFEELSVGDLFIQRVFENSYGGEESCTEFECEVVEVHSEHIIAYCGCIESNITIHKHKSKTREGVRIEYVKPNSSR